MIPLCIFHCHFAALGNASLYWLLEDDFHFTTFTESGVDFTDLFVFLDLDLLVQEKLKISFFIEEIFDYDRIAVNDSIDYAFFHFLFVKFDWYVFLIKYALNSSEKCDSACFLIIVNVRLVSNYFEANICVKLFFQCNDSKYFGSFHFFGLFDHFFIDLIDCQIWLIEVNFFLFWIEKSKFSLDCLMAWHYIESNFIFNWSFVKSN